MSPDLTDVSALTCPSAPCEPGVLAFGVIGADNRVGYLSPPITVDEDFARSLHEAGAPERQFRFASACVEGQCAQWTGDRCSVVDRVAAVAVPVELHTLPTCAIRRTCRWYAQAGSKACRVCAGVVTDQRPVTS